MKRLVYIIPILFLCILSIGDINGQTIDTVWATKDTSIECIGVDAAAPYNNVRDSVAGSGINLYLYVGQVFAGSVYKVYRGFLTFESAISTVIDSIVLELGGKFDGSAAAEFNIYIHSAYYTVPTTASYNDFSGWTAGSAHTGDTLNNVWNSVSYADEAINAIKFNAAGVDSFEAHDGDSLKIALISKEDYNRSAPIGNEYVQFYTSAQAGKSLDARLIVYYTEGSAGIVNTGITKEVRKGTIIKAVSKGEIVKEVYP